MSTINAADFDLLVVSDDGGDHGHDSWNYLAELETPGWKIYDLGNMNVHPREILDRGIMFARDRKKWAVYSHSGHFMYGIRLAVFRGEADCEKIGFVHFNDLGRHLIRMDKRGVIFDWPEGFHDQRDKVFKEMHRI